MIYDSKRVTKRHLQCHISQCILHSQHQQNLFLFVSVKLRIKLRNEFRLGKFKPFIMIIIYYASIASRQNTIIACIKWYSLGAMNGSTFCWHVTQRTHLISRCLVVEIVVWCRCQMEERHHCPHLLNHQRLSPMRYCAMCDRPLLLSELATKAVLRCGRKSGHQRWFAIEKYANKNFVIHRVIIFDFGQLKSF